MGDLFASGGSSSYPTSLDTFTTQTDATPTIPFDATAARASKINNLAQAVVNIETALGAPVSVGVAIRGNAGLTGFNNAGSPTTQYDVAADAVVLTNTSNAAVVRTSTGTVTNNVGTAGPTANGRDQAGAFSASSWVHFYWIWNGTTLATVSSATAPPTGPTLPTGYTHWAYIGAVRFNGSSQLLETYIRGGWATYQDVASAVAVSSGNATTETTVSLAALVPPNAEMISSTAIITFQDTAANVTRTVQLRLATTQDFYTPAVITQVANQNIRQDISLIFPNVSQQAFYLWDAATGTRAFTWVIKGYSMPNGAS